MVKFAVEFWWKMLLTIFPAKEARKSPSKLRRKFATNFAENFANFTLEIAGAYKRVFALSTPEKAPPDMAQMLRKPSVRAPGLSADEHEHPFV